MRRLMGALVVAVFALAMMAGTASATHSNGEGPDKDFLNGSAKLQANTILFGILPSQQLINAQSDSVTSSPAQGSFVLRLFGLGGFDVVEASGPVLCLRAVNNVGIHIDLVDAVSEPAFVAFVGRGILASTEDNGEGSNSPPDRAGGVLIPPPPPNPICPPSNAPIAGLLLPVEQGNQTVHDGI
jgi:hypothetical protein